MMRSVAKHLRRLLSVAACVLALAAPPAAHADLAFIDRTVATHTGATGVSVLEAADDALIARAWLADHATQSIDVQYFIWSTDNIGILAAEALLRAAERGVRVRVLVDDLLVDAPDKALLALALHPQIEIRIYNPQTSVGVPLHTRLLNAATDFRGVNQRMHDKTLIVDDKVLITGGRNMAAEYFDYNQAYNFRDRDAMLVGAAVADARASFDRFWSSELAVAVEKRYDGIGLFQKNVRVGDAEVQQIYQDLHTYARQPENFAPEVRAAIASAPERFERLISQMAWARVEFISDQPGKSATRSGLGGGGATAQALGRLVDGARSKILIQSPYLVLSDAAMGLFRRARERGVVVKISTNSMAATDNLPAFSGYRNQRERLLAMGLTIYEYRPDAEAQRIAMMRRVNPGPSIPVSALHAKTLVVDSQIVYIGTFNLDPRSENLNTEVGAVIHHDAVARTVEAAIEADMTPANSWNAATDQPDQYASAGKRSKVRMLQMMPLRPLL
jgi:putative cardiolipin synthase